MTAKVRSILGGLLVAFALAVVTHGQTTGVVSGVVSGPNGPLADLTVNILNVDSGTIVGTTRTSNNGSYSVANLPPGNYTVQVLSPSRAVLITRTTAVASGVAATVNFSLTASQLASAGMAAGGAGGIGGALSTKAILGIAGLTGAGVGTALALSSDPSPTQ